MKPTFLTLAAVSAALFWLLEPAQAQLWARREAHPNNNHNRAASVVTDSSNNVYVTGSTVNANGDLDFLTVKYSPSGTLLWSRTWNGGHGDDVPIGIALDNNSHVYVVGYSTNANGNRDIRTIKLSGVSGNQQWTKVLDPHGGDDVPTAITTDSDGSLYITATVTNAAGNKDMYAVKYLAHGVTAFLKIWDFGADDWSADIAADSTFVYLVGTSTNAAGNTDIRIIKYNYTTATTAWTTFINYLKDDWGAAVEIDSSGNVYAAGTVTRANDDTDFYLIKYNPNGSMAWANVRSFDAQSRDETFDMKVTPSGEVYLLGTITRAATGMDIHIMKRNTNGVWLWGRQLDYAGRDDWPAAMVLDSAGNLWIAGTVTNANNHTDFYLVRYSATGTLLGSAVYDGTGSSEDRALALALDTQGNALLTGFSVNANATPTYDFLTLKYAP